MTTSHSDAYVPAAYHRDEVGRLRSLLRAAGEILARIALDDDLRARALDETDDEVLDNIAQELMRD